MKIIKCTGRNRQVILDDAAKVLEAEYAAAELPPTQTGPINIVNRHMESRKPAFPVMLEKHIRVNCMYYVHASPEQDGVMKDSCYFVSFQQLYANYTFATLPLTDDQWFTALHKPAFSERPR